MYKMASINGSTTVVDDSSHWQLVELEFSDGSFATATLGKPTVDALLRNDENSARMMISIQKNLEESGQMNTGKTCGDTSSHLGAAKTYQPAPQPETYSGTSRRVQIELPEDPFSEIFGSTSAANIDLENEAETATQQMSTADTATVQTSTADSNWTDIATRSLIVVVQEVLYPNNVRIVTKAGVWQKISEKLSLTGIVESKERCRLKWKAITDGYKKVADNNRTSGSAFRKHPYSELLTFLEGSSDLNPSYVVQSSRNVPEVPNMNASSHSQEPPPKKRKTVGQSAASAILELKVAMSVEEEKNRQLKEKHHREKMDLMRMLFNQPEQEQ